MRDGAIGRKILRGVSLPDSKNHVLSALNQRLPVILFARIER